MASIVDIWNMALGRVKVSALIQGEDERSTESNACNTFWEHSLESTLAALDWNFARSRVSLAELSEAPPSEWTYRYAYPTNCVEARYIYPDSVVLPPDPMIPFQVVLNTAGDARNILCDISPAELTYTRNIVNPVLFSAGFVEALSWKLGAEIGPSLGANAKAVVAAGDSFQTAIQQASVQNIKEGQNREEPDAPHIEARK